MCGVFLKGKVVFAFLSSAVLAVLVSSCSLDYGKQSVVENDIPEITFSNAKMQRVENNKVSMELNAGKLEQYKNSDVSFARKIEFKTWNDNGETETTGKCDLISINSRSKKYALFGNIFVDLASEKMKLNAKNLMWFGDREQLVSGKNDVVSIVRDDIKIDGTGFSASGVSRSFSFSGSIEGEIETEDDNQNVEQDFVE